MADGRPFPDQVTIWQTVSFCQQGGYRVPTDAPALPADGSDARLSIPVEAPAIAPRVRLVDYLRKDMQHITLPQGVSALPAFAALKVEEAEDKAESEDGDDGVPHHVPL